MKTYFVSTSETSASRLARICATISGRIHGAWRVPMSAVPRLSQFWNAPTTNGTYLLTWQDFALNHDTNTLVSAQLELCQSGDYIARSNLVERVYRRVNPDDWDDDGDPNDTDPNPYVYRTTPTPIHTSTTATSSARIRNCRRAQTRTPTAGLTSWFPAPTPSSRSLATVRRRFPIHASSQWRARPIA